LARQAQLPPAREPQRAQQPQQRRQLSARQRLEPAQQQRVLALQQRLQFKVKRLNKTQCGSRRKRNKQPPQRRSASNVSLKW
jgi:hypothetical protein